MVLFPFPINLFKSGLPSGRQSSKISKCPFWHFPISKTSKMSKSYSNLHQNVHQIVQLYLYFRAKSHFWTLGRFQIRFCALYTFQSVQTSNFCILSLLDENLAFFFIGCSFASFLASIKVKYAQNNSNSFSSSVDELIIFLSLNFINLSVPLFLSQTKSPFIFPASFSHLVNLVSFNSEYSS